MKRLLATLLCLSLVLGLVPAATANGSAQTTEAAVVTAQEITTGSRLDAVDLPERENLKLYEDEEMVSVIVELEEEPLLGGFEAAQNGLSAGQQVSAYLQSAAPQADALKSRQDALVERMGQAIGGSVSVTDRFTNIVNAVTVSIPYGKLEEIRAMEGVKNAYVEHVYDRPVTTSGTEISGIHGNSYNMLDVGAVWAEGYTGQGMLVAVLDTGLDLIYSSWGNFETGVRRVHEAFTDDSFMSDLTDAELRYTSGSLARFLQTTQLRVTTGSEGQKIEFAGNALYKTRKVPFAADYADGDLNVYPADSDHGTHVAGTIAGYAETAEGEVIFSGVAPDAQILAMKVFPDSTDSGASESVILNALEDAMLLGADVVNLSLGSDNGWAEDDTAANAAYERLNQAGILFMVSAGNSGDSAYGNHYGDSTLVEDPETSMMSAPAVYDTSMAVGSIQNTVEAQSILFWTDGEGEEHKAAFLDPYTIAMKYSLGEDSWNVIAVDGYGTYDDYYNAGFRSYSGYGSKGVTGIALVKRGGGISFADKINAATQFTWSYYDSAKGTYVTEYPVKAVIIYDEDPEATELIYMSMENAMLTAAFLSGRDGHAMAAAAAQGNVTLRVSAEDEIVASDDAGQMSSFSSWGAGPALELKPEITAPGGNIWSSIIDTTYEPANASGVYDDYVGTYGMMDGTSMAAPHMTGIALLVEQAVRLNYGLTAKNAVAELTEHLLVSTAVPQPDENGVYYSPRYQGAGLVNAAAAITTPAYISVEGASVGKLELKDDPDRTGTYELTFQVNSISDRDVTYDLSATLMRPMTDVFESQWGSVDVALDRDLVLIDAELGTVTVPAGKTVTVSRTLALTAQQKAEIDALFPNGTYVEGFVALTAENEPRIGLPVLAFYGDWTAAPIFDRSIWYETPADGESLFNNPSTMGNTFIGSTALAGYVNLGQNVFDPFFGDQSSYHVENFTISPNGDGYLDSVNDFVLYQLREAKLVVVEVHDAETDALYYRDYAGYQFKSLYYDAYGYAIPASQFYFTNTTWGGTDLEGNVLPSGTECVMTVTAWGDGDYGEGVYEASEGRLVTDFDAVASGDIVPTFNGHEMDLTGDVLQFPVTIDTVAPKLVNNTVSIYQGKDGRTYLTGTVEDADGSIASVEVHPYVKRTANYAPDSYDYDTDQLNPFYTNHVYDPATKTLTFTCDVTEYAHTIESWEGESEMYSFEWTGNVIVSCGDYGLNDRSYAISINNAPGLLLSQTSALLYVGSQFELSVTDNSGLEGALVRTSSNPEVATIDEFGLVTALTPGQTTITISKGEQEAVCIVAVREKTTEVIDFKLSLEHFSGLKPNGSVIVKVTDLEPANVELTQKHWIINEDDPDLYAGLINVAQYDTTGLIGEIYLNYNATGDPEIQVPGASATLDVTLNGVTRSMTIDWTDLYTYSNEDDLVSDLAFEQQTLYVTQGDTATLSAKYSNAGLHESSDVKLYTAVGYTEYSYSNPTVAAIGLVLDGPDFSTAGNTWTGRLVNEGDFALPERIRVLTRYSSGYEYEMTNSWRQEYSYNAETGEISIFFPPESATSTLVIRADGVKSEGNPAGTILGGSWERPEPVYGPFDWEIVDGTGTLTTGTETGYYGNEIHVAWYEPAEPGVSIIKATTRDGTKSVRFAVISEPVMPESLTLERKHLTIGVADSAAIAAVLDPIPTEERHSQIKWESYEPSVASVDENGIVTGVSEGYAYLRAYTDVGTALETTCIVQVVPCAHENTTTSTVEPSCETDGAVTVVCGHCGATVCETVIPGGHRYEALVTAPTCEEQGFTTHTCTVCGERQVDSFTDPLGHSFELLTEAVSCQNPGYTQHVCVSCGYVFIDGIREQLECADFADVPLDAWFHDAVDFVVAEGLMVGVSADQFNPTGLSNRAQVVTVLYRMAGSPAVEGEMPFTDVSEDAWYHDAVLWACQNGITQGMTATTFGPGASINRAQLVTFLHRFAAPESADTGVLDRFPDAGDVPAFALESFSWAIQNGLVAGMDGMLNPGGTANRAQLATILMRFVLMG